jgi:hypothetical protein
MRAYNNGYDTPSDDRRTIPVQYNQTAWAVSNPNWGEPQIILETVRESQDAALFAFLNMVEWGLYTGATEFPLPSGTPGDWDQGYRHGFRLVKIQFNQFSVEVE